MPENESGVAQAESAPGPDPARSWVDLPSAPGERAVPASPSAAADPPCFDLAAMLRNLDDDVELVRELAGFFVTSAGELLAGMRLAVAGGNAGALGSGAHAMKGAAANFHAAGTVAAAAAVETFARQGDLVQAGSEFARLEAEVGRLIPVLEALRDSSSVAGAS